MVMLGSSLCLGSEPITYKELSLLVRMEESQASIASQIAKRKMLYPLTLEQQAELKSFGLTDANIQALQDPRNLASRAMVELKQSRDEIQKKAQQRALEVATPLSSSERAAKDDFTVFDVEIGQTINLSQWGGLNNDVVFYVKAGKTSDEIFAVITDNTRIFTDASTTPVSAGTDSNGRVYVTGGDVTMTSYSPKQYLRVNTAAPTLVQGLPFNLYSVYGGGGVELFYIGISTTRADSVKLAIKVYKK